MTHPSTLKFIHTLASGEKLVLVVIRGNKRPAFRQACPKFKPTFEEEEEQWRWYDHVHEVLVEHLTPVEQIALDEHYLGE